MSAVSAVISYYESLTAANFPGGVRPSIFFGGVPVVSGTTPTVLPWVNLVHKGTTPHGEFQGHFLATCWFAFEVFAEKLADVEATVRAIRWNGQDPTACAGFDMALAIPMAGYAYEAYSCVQDGAEVEGRERELSKDVKFAHKSFLPYRLQYRLSGAYPTTTAAP